MQNTTPQLITRQQFNTKIKGWTLTVRSKIASNAPRSTGSDSKFRTSERLSGSITSELKKTDNVYSRIRYKFSRHGVFVHYGVGRGYIRVGNNVIKGSRNGGKSKSVGFNRHAEDWYDVEIRAGIREIAEISQEYYGDWALNDMLSKLEKFTIQRK